MRTFGTKMAVTAVIWSLASACSSGPPPGFAPDPGLVTRMESIEMIPSSRTLCPGGEVQMDYYAVMEDGARIPFETRYDEDNPPTLHMVMLNRFGRDVTPQGNGSWRARRDPLRTAMSGFELNASLKVNPSIAGAEVLEPEYSCVQNAFSFSGRNGSRGQAGRNGQDVVVRIGILSSPYVDRLLVAGVEVEQAPAIYLLFDADRVRSADWLHIVARGGRGGRGIRGEQGVQGAQGTSGSCPGEKGAPGGAGGVGGPGGTGGRGGRVTVIVSEDDRLLAGLVDVEVPGGRGGEGGDGGAGGTGGEGGTPGTRRSVPVSPGVACTAGVEGDSGPDGPEGREGRDGRRGPSMEIIEVSEGSVFGNRVPPSLAELIDYHRGR